MTAGVVASKVREKREKDANMVDCDIVNCKLILIYRLQLIFVNFTHRKLPRRGEKQYL